MNDFCPNCEKETPLNLFRKREEFNIRGEAIPVEVEYFRCQECGQEFENPQSEPDPYEIAYREYRKRKGMAQPEEIKSLRIRYGLTQKEFNDLLGIGIATLNRYENGALQSEAHNRILQMAMDARYFLNLVSGSQGIIPDSKRQEIVDRLWQETAISWLEITKEIFGNYSPDIFSGYKRLDLEKLVQAIKYFCFKDGVFKTKLMKLLFYADFAHFKEYAVSITGVHYARLPYGPVPDQFEKWLAVLLSDDESFRKEEVWYGENPGEVFTCDSAPDISIFSPSELKMLAAVQEKFQGFNAKKMSELSHQEKGYQETENARLISFHYAEQLNVDFNVRGG